MIQSLSEDQGSIKRGSDPSRIGVDSDGQAYNLRYGRRTIFSGTGDFQNMIKALEDFRSDPSFQKQYDDLHNRALKLAEEADKIEEDLSLIQAYVRAGNFIKGSCEAGIDAGYEVKANETPFS